MSVRVYICPWDGTGTHADIYRSRAQTLGYKCSYFLPTLLSGHPASVWVPTVVYANDFTSLDADPACDDVFAGDLPPAVQTREDLLQFLRGRTVSDVPVARRNAIIAVFDKYAINRADFVGATPLWKVFRRMASAVWEQDDRFSDGF